MAQHTYKVKGMHCASCSAIIEKTLKKVEGVHSAEVNYGTETAKVTFDEAKTNHHHLSQKVEHLGYSLVAPKEQSMSHAGGSAHAGMSAADMGMSESEHAAHLGLNQTKEEKLAELADMKWKVLSAIPLTVFSAFVLGWETFAQFGIAPSVPYVWEEFFHHLLPIMATYMLFVVGKPYLLGFYRFLRYGHANMDTLIGLGTSAAFLYSFAVTAFEESLRPYVDVGATYYDVTIIVIAFTALGKYLEAQSKLKTGDAIEKLLNLQAKTALVVRDGKEVEIPVDQVVHGELIIVKPAGKIPVDGTLTEGESFVDESMITGIGSPVIIDLSTKDSPSASVPSTGIFPAGFTMISSPWTT